MKKLRGHVPSILVACIYLSACSTSQQRGHLELEGTIFAGWSEESYVEKISPDNIVGSYYRCAREFDPSELERPRNETYFRCTLVLSDGEPFDGEVDEEKVTLVYQQNNETHFFRLRPSMIHGDRSQGHFRFRVSTEVASQLQRIELSAPVVMTLQ